MNSPAAGVAAVLLAAGGSRRFGSAKQLVTWQGRPLVRWMAETLITSRVQTVVVVVGFESQAVCSALEGLTLQCIDNPEWQRGQSTSIRAGLQALPPDLDAALFVPCDQPLLTSQTLNRAIAEHLTHPDSIIVPRYGKHRSTDHGTYRGAPVLWPRLYFDDLKSLGGDTGGRSLLRENTQKIVELEVDNADEGRDVDTPEALERLSAARKS